MAQHFLLSSAARTLSLKSVYQMGEEKAYERFCAIRWEATDGEPICPRRSRGSPADDARTVPMPLTFVNDGHIARSGEADVGLIIKRPDGGWFWSIAVIKSNPPMQGSATSKGAAQKELRAKWEEWLEWAGLSDA